MDISQCIPAAHVSDCALCCPVPLPIHRQITAAVMISHMYSLLVLIFYLLICMRVCICVHVCIYNDLCLHACDMHVMST